MPTQKVTPIFEGPWTPPPMYLGRVGSLCRSRQAGRQPAKPCIACWATARCRAAPTRARLDDGPLHTINIVFLHGPGLSRHRDKAADGPGVPRRAVKGIL